MKLFKYMVIAFMNIAVMISFTSPIFAEEKDIFKSNTADSNFSVSYINNSEFDEEAFANMIVQYDALMYGDTDDIEQEIVLYDEELFNIPDSVILNYISTTYFPITATSSGYDTCFSKVSWILRNGIWSLSVYPKFKVGGYNKDQAWSFLKAVHVGNTQWNYRNVNSMYNQFVCHYDFGGNWKVPWNLEPATADKVYWGFVASFCN